MTSEKGTPRKALGDSEKVKQAFKGVTAGGPHMGLGKGRDPMYEHSGTQNQR